MAVLLVGLLGQPTFTSAADIPVPEQPKGYHSQLCASDSDISDKALADKVCQSIQAHGGQVKDVKIMAQGCYGGGLLDDFQRVFGPGGACAGIPWVGGTAASPYEEDCDWGGELEDPPDGFGCVWTNALAGSQISPSNEKPGTMRDHPDHKVLQDLQEAKKIDQDNKKNREQQHGLWTQPGRENGVVGSGNGGDSITWDGGKKHKAIMFSGMDDSDPAYTKVSMNLQNMYGALLSVGVEEDDIKAVDGGTAQDLWDAIDAQCADLDADTELILYFTGHGTASIDLGELGEWSIPYLIEQYKKMIYWLNLGISLGLVRNVVQCDPAAPVLAMYLAAPIEGSEWVVKLNGAQLPLPPQTLSGEVRLPVYWPTLQREFGEIEIYAIGTPSSPMLLNALVLESGPIREHHSDPPCLQPPGACCYPDGHCEYVIQADCYSGDWRIGMPCTLNPCPQPLGACCYPDGHCEHVVQAACNTGDWRMGVPCDPNPCTQPGGVVWTEPPCVEGRMGSSEQALCYGLESEIANDFSVSENTTITVARFWGGYWNNTNPCDPGMTYHGHNLRFYEDCGCIPCETPDHRRHYAEYLNINCDEGAQIYCQGGLYPIYDYQAWVSVPVYAGYLYWFGAQMCDHPSPPQWGRLAACHVTGNDSVFWSPYFGYPDWTPCIDVFGEAFDASQEFEGGHGGEPAACCFPDDHCEVLPSLPCAAQGGQPQGVGTVCDPNPCAARGAQASDGEATASTLANQLFQNEPNPFKPTTTIKFSLAENGSVRITLFDISGRSVKTILDGKLTAGIHSVIWNGTDDQGKALPSGVYWMQMQAGAYLSTKRLIVMR